MVLTMGIALALTGFAALVGVVWWFMRGSSADDETPRRTGGKPPAKNYCWLAAGLAAVPAVLAAGRFISPLVPPAVFLAAAGCYAGGAYILRAKPDSVMAGWLAGHLPKVVVRSMLRMAGYLGFGDRAPEHHVTHPVSYSDGVRDDPGARTAPPARAAGPALPPLPGNEPAPPAGAVAPASGESAFPPEWGVVPVMIATFEPGDDAEMMNLWRADAAFQVACADAWRAQFDHLVNGLGLDPAAVQGVAEYADERADSAHSANLVVQRFLTVYAEVKNYLANGGTMPHDGRFLTEEGA